MKIKRISVGKIMVIIIAGLFVLYTIEGFGTKSEISSYLEKRCDEPVEVSFTMSIFAFAEPPPMRMPGSARFL